MSGTKEINTQGRVIADRLSDRADELEYDDVRVPKTAELLHEAAVKLRKATQALKALLAEYECGDRECEDEARKAIVALEERL